MISNEKVVNYKVVDFNLGRFSICGRLYISKFERFKQNSETVNGFK
jgi:hypothetical protein